MKLSLAEEHVVGLAVYTLTQTGRVSADGARELVLHVMRMAAWAPGELSPGEKYDWAQRFAQEAIGVLVQLPPFTAAFLSHLKVIELEARIEKLEALAEGGEVTPHEDVGKELGLSPTPANGYDQTCTNDLDWTMPFCKYCGRPDVVAFGQTCAKCLEERT